CELPFAAELTDQIETATVRQHQIENDQIGVLGAASRVRVGARDVDVEAVASQRVRDDFGDRGLVFDDENASGHQRLVSSRTSGAAAETKRSRCSGSGRVPAK